MHETWICNNTEAITEMKTIASINHHNNCHCTDDSNHSNLLLVLCDVRTYY